MPKFPPIPFRVASHLLYIFHNILITLNFCYLTLIIFCFPLFPSMDADQSLLTPRVFIPMLNGLQHFCITATFKYWIVRKRAEAQRLNDRILQLFTLVNIRSCGSVRKRKANDLSITPGVSTSWFQSTDVSQIFFNHPSDYTIGSLSSQMLSTHRVSPPMATNRLQLIMNHHQWHKWPLGPLLI